jgi:hypothetical protein
VTPEILQHGKIVAPQINDAADAARKEKESDYRITKKIDSVCPNLSTYLKAINSMAEVDDMDLMLRILKKMCAEILSTADSTQNKNDKSNRKPDHANSSFNLLTINTADAVILRRPPTILLSVGTENLADEESFVANLQPEILRSPWFQAAYGKILSSQLSSRCESLPQNDSYMMNSSLHRLTF